MNKSVLMSIQPKWCELIVSGRKTIEVRKTRPKLETPFKCYIYMTATKERCRYWEYITAYQNNKGDILDGSQKVIGEFVCDKIYTRPANTIYLPNAQKDYLDLLKSACLTEPEALAYMGGQYNKDMYFWHITALKIYDTLKELGEFKKECKQYGADNPFCDDCIYFDCCRGGDYDESDCVVDGLIPLTYPFQSWGYVCSNE